MERFIVVKGWMIDVLNLTGCDLLCYATIYGFSQPNKGNRTVGEWNGTTQELADWVGYTQRQVKRSLSNLITKNLIKITHEIIRNGGEKTNCYVATAVTKCHRQLGQNVTASGDKMSPPDPCSSYTNINKIHKAGEGVNQPFCSVASKSQNKPSEDSQPFAGEVEFHDVSKSSKQDRQAYAEATEVAKELARIYGNERAATKLVVSRVKVLLETYTRFELSTAIRNAMADSERRRFQLKSLLGDDMIATLARKDGGKKYTTMRTVS